MKKCCSIIAAVVLCLLLSVSVAGAATPPLRYVVDEGFPPYSHLTGNRLEGFDIELMGMIFEDSPYQLEIIPLKWTDALDEMSRGEADVISSIVKMDDRQDYLLFSDVIAHDASAFFGISGKDFALDNLQSSGYRIGVGTGYYEEHLLQETLGIDEYHTFTDLRLAMQALLAGRIDLIFGDEKVVQYFLIQNRLQGRISPVETGLFPRGYHFGISKNQPALLSFINGRLRELRTSGAYEALYQKHFFELSPYQMARQRRYYWALTGLGLLSLLILIVGIRHLSMRKQFLELAEKNRLIEYMAYHDEFTGLPNKRALNDYLRNAMQEADQRGTSVAFMIMDLDDFQMVNDTYGHKVGDQVIKELSERIVQVIPENAMLSRHGGDEFALCVGNVNHREEVQPLVTTMMQIIRRRMPVNNMTLHPCMSIGIAFYPTDAADQQTLFTYADAALYKAKNMGRNSSVFFSPEIYQQVRHNIETEVALRRALKKNEFSLVYQPLIDSVDETVCGTEVLIRWHHPQEGLVSPGDFIPVAERTGQIIEIGQWVLEEVCRHIQKWQETIATPMPVSINLSLKQLQKEAFVDEFKQTLLRYGVSPSQIKLEVTETVAMVNPEEAIETLKSLSALGVRLSLDDFGTGYSSMSYLKMMPVNEVKMDRSFLWKMENDKTQELIVSTIVDLVHALGRKVVAEGVETEHQKQLLQHIGCDVLQGYYYAKPMSLEAFMAWLEERQQR